MSAKSDAKVAKKDYHIKSLVNGGVLGFSSVFFVMVVTWSFAPLFFYTGTTSQLSLAYFYSLGEAVVLALVFIIPFLIVTRRENNKRQSAAKRDATKARLIADASLVSVQFPIIIETEWNTRNRRTAIGFAIAGPLFMLFLGWNFVVVVDYQLLGCFVAAAILILCVFLYQWNRYIQRLTVDERGIELRQRWTTQFIPWSDVRLLWMSYPKQQNAANAVYPTSGAVYEVASATTRITITVIGKGRTDFHIPDRPTYYERVVAVLAAIMQRGGVGLWGERSGSPSKESSQVMPAN